MVVNGRLDIATSAGAGIAILELPGVPALALQQAWVVVSLVEILEHGREDLGNLFGQLKAFVVRFEELAPATGGEEGREGEDVFVGGEEALLRADADGDNCGG